MDSMHKIRTRALERRRGEYLGRHLGKGLCFSQHDMDVANGSGATVRADYNLALKALASRSAGGTEPGTTFAYQDWADTTATLMKQRNAANLAWLVRGTLAETFVTSRSSDTALAKADYERPFVATSGFTQSFVAAATLADGWWCAYRVNSGVTIVFDPNSSENIDGATTKTVVGPASGLIYCSGSAFFTYGFDNPAASDTVAGVLEIATQAEQETGTDVARAVSPGRQQFHASALKAWLKQSVSGGTVTVAGSYNVTSVTDNGAGDFTANFTTAFSGTGYAAVGVTDVSLASNNGPRTLQVHTQSAGSFRFTTNADNGAIEDNHEYTALHFAGDQ